MEKLVQGAPRPNAACRVVIVNGTELPLTAVCIKWLLAHRLAPGATSASRECPTSEEIEFQFGERESAHDDILWARPSLGLRRARSYRIEVRGPAAAPSFRVHESEGDGS